MPTLSDTQGGVVTVSGGNVASEKSWVTIIPGDPVAIHGEPKTTGQLWWDAQVNFGAAAIDASVSGDEEYGSAQPASYYRYIDAVTVFDPGQFTVFGYGSGVNGTVSDQDTFRVEFQLLFVEAGKTPIHSIEAFFQRINLPNPTEVAIVVRDINGTRFWPENQNIRMQIYDNNF